MNVKKLISNEVIELVNSSLDYCEISQLDLSKHFAIKIGNVLIQKSPEGKPYMTVPEGLGKEYMSMWRNDVGQVLLRELKKDEPEVYEFKTGNFTALTKKVSHEEEENFSENGFLHIKVGDYYYTIIKVISAGSQYYKKTCDFDYELYMKEDENIIVVNDKSEEKKEEENYAEKSYRLF